MNPQSSIGILLFAHGSSVAAWRVPFDSITHALHERYPNTPIVLAFLEFTDPDFMAGVSALLSANPHLKTINIIPLFLAESKHTGKDIPRLVDEWKTAHQNTVIEFIQSPSLLSQDSFRLHLQNHLSEAISPLSFTVKSHEPQKS